MKRALDPDAVTPEQARRNRDALADPDRALSYVRAKLAFADEDGMVVFVLQAVRALADEVERLRADQSSRPLH